MIKDNKEKIKEYRKDVLNTLLKSDKYEAEYIMLLIRLFVFKKSNVSEDSMSEEDSD